jgi:hypothetical protein
MIVMSNFDDCIKEIKEKSIQGYNQGNPFKFEDVLQVVAEYEGHDNFTDLLENE